MLIKKVLDLEYKRQTRNVPVNGKESHGLMGSFHL